jgi:glycerate-2-kinase
MARARGKYSQAISDRSGVAFPYKEMVKEWNGSFVHKSEYESKHPQLEPKPVAADAQALENARPKEAHTVVAKIGGGAESLFSVVASGSTQPADLIKDLTMKFKIGTITVSTS